MINPWFGTIQPGGDEIPVTFYNRTEYADLVEQYRMQEFALQATAIRRGLAQVIPQRLLTLFTWDELEVSQTRIVRYRFIKLTLGCWNKSKNVPTGICLW